MSRKFRGTKEMTRAMARVIFIDGLWCGRSYFAVFKM